MQQMLSTMLVRAESVFAARVRNLMERYETTRNVLLTVTVGAGGVMRELPLVAMDGVNLQLEVWLRPIAMF